MGITKATESVLDLTSTGLQIDQVQSNLDTAESDLYDYVNDKTEIKLRITQQNNGFWGDIIYKDADEIVIKPKAIDGITPWIGAILNDGSYIEDSSEYTIKYDVPGSSGHILDGITAKLNNEWFIVWAYEDSSGDLAFGITWMPYTTFSNANPTTTLTLNQVNSQDIGYLFNPGGHVVIWQDTDELETPFGYNDGGSFTYDTTNDTETSISSRTATVLTLGGTLNNTTFTASSTVYQVDNFKPLAIDDGLIVDVIGSGGYKDTGFRFMTDGSGNIHQFHIYDGNFVFKDAYSKSISITSTATNYLITYLPPDKQKVNIRMESVTTATGGLVSYFYWDLATARYVSLHNYADSATATECCHRIFGCSATYNVSATIYGNGYVL